MEYVKTKCMNTNYQWPTKVVIKKAEEGRYIAFSYAYPDLVVQGKSAKDVKDRFWRAAKHVCKDPRYV